MISTAADIGELLALRRLGGAIASPTGRRTILTKSADMFPAGADRGESLALGRLDGLIVSPAYGCAVLAERAGVYGLGVIAGTASWRASIWRGERRHIPRVVRCGVHALVCLVVHQVTDSLAGVTVGHAYRLYGVAGLVLLPHGQDYISRDTFLAHVTSV